MSEWKINKGHKKHQALEQDTLLLEQDTLLPQMEVSF